MVLFRVFGVMMIPKQQVELGELSVSPLRGVVAVESNISCHKLAGSLAAALAVFDERIVQAENILLLVLIILNGVSSIH
jgi:hypothetical protein